jgi:hypothetical protein
MTGWQLVKAYALVFGAIFGPVIFAFTIGLIAWLA